MFTRKKRLTGTVRAVPLQVPARPLRCANLEIWPLESQALVDGRPLGLTAREFEVLLALAQQRNRVVARAELYERVWRRPMGHRDRAVDVFIRRLRGKLGVAAPSWVYIHTHFGVGYRFTPERGH
jgi:DNA-binding response OmpR family regulator